MKRIVPILLLVWWGSMPSCFADTIYLKSGKVLEGKLKENQPSAIREEWCSGEDDVELVQASSSQCLKRDHIDRVETIRKEPSGVALLAKDDQWGPEENGYRTQLIPAASEYIVGEPVKIHLVMKNVSDKVKWYDVQGVGSVLAVKDAAGLPVLSKKTIVQTFGGEQAVDAGEIVVLFEDRDITKDFVIIRPGDYTLQITRGDYAFSIEMVPVSNILRIHINPGLVKAEDFMIDALVKILPDKTWQVTPGLGKYPDGPVGWLAVDSVEVQMIRHTGKAEETITIQLWQTNELADPDPRYNRKSTSEYLGHDSGGKHYYALIPVAAAGSWLTAREDIIKALAVEQE